MSTYAPMYYTTGPYALKLMDLHELVMTGRYHAIHDLLLSYIKRRI